MFVPVWFDLFVLVSRCFTRSEPNQVWTCPETFIRSSLLSFWSIRKFVNKLLRLFDLRNLQNVFVFMLLQPHVKFNAGTQTVAQQYHDNLPLDVFGPKWFSLDVWTGFGLIVYGGPEASLTERLWFPPRRQTRVLRPTGVRKQTPVVSWRIKPLHLFSLIYSLCLWEFGWKGNVCVFSLWALTCFVCIHRNINNTTGI